MSKTLPPGERLRLATLILQSLAQSVVDESSEWSDRDLREFSDRVWDAADTEAGTP